MAAKGDGRFHPNKPFGFAIAMTEMSQEASISLTPVVDQFMTFPNRDVNDLS